MNKTVNTADYPELASQLGESGATMTLPFIVNRREYSVTHNGGGGDVEAGGGVVEGEGDAP